MKVYSTISALFVGIGRGMIVGGWMVLRWRPALEPEMEGREVASILILPNNSCSLQAMGKIG